MSYPPEITLRDYFAAKAMQANVSTYGGIVKGEKLLNMAVHSYRAADAMLEARKEKTMAHVEKSTQYSVRITEQTLKELNKAIEEAKEKNNKATEIEVKSAFSNVSFYISLGQCESLGYSLGLVDEKRAGKIIEES